MGANEHGVVIGNEAVFTDQPYADRRPWLVRRYWRTRDQRAGLTSGPA